MFYTFYIICCTLLVSVDTQQADYHVTATVTYRANGVVSEQSCLSNYQKLMAAHYTNLDGILTQRCSAINVNMNVSFVRSLLAAP